MTLYEAEQNYQRAALTEREAEAMYAKKDFSVYSEFTLFSRVCSATDARLEAEAVILDVQFEFKIAKEMQAELDADADRSAGEEAFFAEEDARNAAYDANMQAQIDAAVFEAY